MSLQCSIIKLFNDAVSTTASNQVEGDYKRWMDKDS